MEPPLAEPRMAFPEIERPSPNFGPGANERLGVLFHHSELAFA